MKVMKYKLFPIEGVCIYPHKYECTISSGSLALYDLPTWNDSLCFLPKMHPSQSLFGCSINDKPFTMFFLATNLDHWSLNDQTLSAITMIDLRGLLWKKQTNHFATLKETSCFVSFGLLQLVLYVNKKSHMDHFQNAN